METKNEIWKDIEGWEGYYQVSNFGRVRSLDREVFIEYENGLLIQRFIKGCILSPGKVGRGYLAINLQKNGIAYPCRIHRLVAMAFVLGYKDGFQVNHIDENKENNRYDNLEWVSGITNVRKSSLIEKNAKKLRKPVVQLSNDGNFIHRYDSIRQASICCGLHKSHIKDVCHRKRKSAGGYRWKFADE